MGTPRRRYHWAIAVYDRVYRFCHGLHSPRSVVPPALRLEVCRCYRTVRLGDGTLIRPGDLIGVLHLHNEAVARLHENGLSPMAVGLEFRRQFLDSLFSLAELAMGSGRVAEVKAFVAVTIFHGLQRIGFEVEPRGPMFATLIGAYQRALLASLHPDGVFRLEGMAGRAQRHWISRERLLALHRSRRHRRAV